jgi:hypothetical protein
MADEVKRSTSDQVPGVAGDKPKPPSTCTRSKAMPSRCAKKSPGSDAAC